MPIFALVAGCSAGGPAESPAPIDANDVPPVDYVATAFHVAPADVGADLDGDGVVDNAIAPLGAALDPILADRLATTTSRRCPTGRSWSARSSTR